MGCSNSRSSADELDSINRLKLEKQNYHQRHENFENLCQDIFTEMRRALDPSDKQAIQKMKKEIISRKTNINNLSESELEECIKEFMTQIYIEEYELIQKYDVYRLTLETINDLNLFNNNSIMIDLSKNLLENYNRIFPKMQKGVFLNFSDLECDTSILNSLINNFKFNISFNLEALNIITDSFFLKNFQLCQGIADLIEINKRLQSLMINIYDEKNFLTQEMLLSLDNIFISLRKNNSIRFLSIQAFKDGMYNLTPEMEKSLLSIISRDSLYGLYLGKFGLSDNFMIEFFKLIVNCKNLRVILIDSKTSNINLLDDLIIHGIGRNRSIQVVVIAGFNISEMKSVEYKQVQKHNEMIKIFEYVREIVFDEK